MGVVSNLTPAANVFTMQAQRCGILVMIFFIPGFYQVLMSDEIDWRNLLTVKSFFTLMITVIFLNLWMIGLFYGSTHMI